MTIVGEPARPTKYKEKPKVISLPSKGRAILIADLHGHISDFEIILCKTRILERIEEGEDLYFIITGDICDLERYQEIDPDIPSDGDIAILDILIDAKNRLGEAGERIIYLEGNHDFNVLRIAYEMEEYGGDLEAYLDDYLKVYGKFFFFNNITPYDIISRIEKRHLDFIGSGPLLVKTASGLVVTHAGPVRYKKGMRDILNIISKLNRYDSFHLDMKELHESPYFQLLNNRYILNDYTLGDLEKFLKVLGSKILITGHTPISYFMRDDESILQNCELYNGLIILGGKQVIFATSYGAGGGKKVFLDLDLSRKYRYPKEWNPGVEIQELNPEED